MLEGRILPDTVVWSGASPFSSNWSDGLNWQGFAPQPGDDLVFPEAAAKLTSNNDFAPDTAFQSLSFTGSGLGFGTGYTITGASIVLTGGGINETSGLRNTLNLGGITLGTSQAFTVTSGDLQVDSNVALGPHTLTLANNTGFPGPLPNLHGPSAVAAG